MIRDLDLENKIIWSMSALIGLLIILAFFVASHNDSLANDKEWNNGYCLECEEQYQYIDSITESVLFFSETVYIYECPKCHKHIRTKTFDNK